MKPIHARLAGGIAITIAIAACVPRPRPAPPVQAPPPMIVPTIPPPMITTPWPDMPQTAGNWTYQASAAGGRASFAAGGAALFAMRCDAGARTIVLTRLNTPAGRQITVRSETQTRALPATPDAGGLSARLAASDRLLDAMALSKGRFAVEAAGTQTLYLPAWAEVTRVIEDCR